jgi:cytochrome c oxidase subunit 2
MKKLAVVPITWCLALGFISARPTKIGAEDAEHVIQITAKRFEFSPGEITVKKGEQVVLEIKSEDVKHGFSLPDFSVHAAITPGEVSRVRFVPDKTGEFAFVCDIFCGNGHEDMEGTIKVVE